MKTTLWTAALAAVLFAMGCGSGREEVESPPSGHPADDEVLARVGDREIRVRDLLHKIQVQLPAMGTAKGVQDVRQKRQVLQQMLDQYCWVLLAEENGWDQDPEFRTVLELSRKYILANHSAEKAVYSKAQPKPEEVEAYYRENADEFRIAPSCKAAQIVVATRAEAEEIRRTLAGGADFTALAQERSLDRTARSGGLLGTISEGVEVKGHPGRRDLAQLILSLGEGGISEPTEVSGGWALFRAYEVSPERARSFDEVSSFIQETLYKKKANELFAEALAEVRERAKAEIDDRAFVHYAVSLMSDVEIQAMAASETDPRVKIAYYEGLLREHPGSVIAPQAKFMIGFLQADELEEYDGARKTFEEMIQSYPDDELVASARWMLANLGKDLDGDPQLEQIRTQAREKRKSK